MIYNVTATQKFANGHRPRSPSALEKKLFIADQKNETIIC